jgi:hypothetical protein
MGLDVFIAVLIKDSNNLYTPIWYCEESDKYFPYVSDKPFDLEEIHEIYEGFTLLSFYKPYSLMYHLAGIEWIHKLVMDRYKGRGCTGVPPFGNPDCWLQQSGNTHPHFKQLLSPAGDNCVSLLLSDLKEYNFDVLYKFRYYTGESEMLNLKDLSCTQRFMEFIKNISKFVDETALVVIRIE